MFDDFHFGHGLSVLSLNCFPYSVTDIDYSRFYASLVILDGFLAP